MASKYPGMSPYNYCLNNPLRLVDQNGKEPGDPIPFLSSISKGKAISQGIFALNNPIATYFVLGISSDVENLSTHAGLAEDATGRGTETNAYRHALWQAAITTELSSDIAKSAGDAHEGITGADLSKRSFTSLESADKTIDLLNNVIGRNLGINNPNASMGQLSKLTLNYYHEVGLWVKEVQSDGSIHILQRKLSDESYERALRKLKEKEEEIQE